MLCVAVFDGVPRSKNQIDSTSGGMIGEASRDGGYISTETLFLEFIFF